MAVEKLAMEDSSDPEKRAKRVQLAQADRSNPAKAIGQLKKTFRLDISQKSNLFWFRKYREKSEGEDGSKENEGGG